MKDVKLDFPQKNIKMLGRYGIIRLGETLLFVSLMVGVCFSSGVFLCEFTRPQRSFIILHQKFLMTGLDLLQL